jgi:hypothetical protein
MSPIDTDGKSRRSWATVLAPMPMIPVSDGASKTDVAGGTTSSPEVPRSWVDESIAGALGYFSQRVSRRGLLAKVGKLTLAALGVSIAWDVLPLDRRVEIAKAATCDIYHCCWWSYCGLYGRTCTCCNGGNLPNYCAVCSTYYSYWSSCCCKSSEGTKYNIYYWDCCNSCCSSSCNGCLWCSRYGGKSKPAWCNGTPYCCTAIVKGSTCGTC